MEELPHGREGVLLKSVATGIGLAYAVCLTAAVVWTFLWGLGLAARPFFLGT